MAAQAKIAVLPGSPDTPETIEITCAGLDSVKSVELMIDDVVVQTERVDPDGAVSASYVVSEGKRVALANLGETQVKIPNTRGRNLLRLKDGTHSMALRYLT